MQNQGPSIKYVTPFLANFDPFPLSHFVTHPGTPKKYVTHLGPPIFSRPSTKHPNKNLKKPCTNSLSIVREAYVRGILSRVLEDFVRGGFVRSPSVRIHLLQQIVKRHFKCQISYV